MIWLTEAASFSDWELMESVFRTFPVGPGVYSHLVIVVFTAAANLFHELFTLGFRIF